MSDPQRQAGAPGTVTQLPNAKRPRRTLKERVEAAKGHWEWSQTHYFDIILGCLGLLAASVLIRNRGGTEGLQIVAPAGIGTLYWWLRTHDWFFAAVCGFLVAAGIAVISDRIGGLPSTATETVALILGGIVPIGLAVSIMRGKRP